MKTKIKVRDYTDYRLFFHAHVEAMKESWPRWSLGVWSRHLDVSKAALVKIMAGGRIPGPKIIAKLIKYFEFTDAEEAHFRRIVQFRKTRETPDFASAVLDSLKFQEGHWTDFDTQSLVVMSQWYHAPVLALWLLAGKDPDPAVVASKLGGKITSRQVQEAIDELAAANIIMQGKNGIWQISKSWPALKTNRMRAMSPKSIRTQSKWIRDVLHVTERRLSELSPSQFDFRVSTIGLKAEKVQQAMEYIAEFESKFAHLFSDRGAKDVYQIQIQFLPW